MVIRVARVDDIPQFIHRSDSTISDDGPATWTLEKQR